jgi:hypothetical protein
MHVPFALLTAKQEARRITTPPLKETNNGRVRSLFTEVDNFTGGDTTSEADARSVPSSLNFGGGGATESDTMSSSGSSKQYNQAYRKAADPSASLSHWFDDEEEDSTRKDKRKKKSKPDFALNVPEHLPTSPLCPVNPRHPSGGNGVCVVSVLGELLLVENRQTDARATPVPRKKIRCGQAEEEAVRG